MRKQQNDTSKPGIVWRQDQFNLEPLRDKIRELEAQGGISSMCREAKISRNQVYLILKGEPTREKTLVALLNAVGLSWDRIMLKKTDFSVPDM